MKRIVLGLFITVCSFSIAQSQMFSTFTATNTGSNELLSNELCDIDFKNNGAVVIGSHLGLSVFHDNSWENLNLYGTNCFDIDADDNIWIGTFGGKVVKYDGTSTTEHQLTSLANCDGACAILSCHVDKEGNIWFGTMEGLYMWDGENWTHFSEAPAFISSIIDGAEGNVWFASEYYGIACYDGSDWKIYNESDGLLSNSTRTICYDSSGKIWAGTGSGVSVFDGSDWNNITVNEGLLDNNIIYITQNIDDRIWIVTSTGISIYNGTSWDYIDSIGDIDFSRVVTLNKDIDSLIWIGTWNNGAYTYDDVSIEHIRNGDGISGDYVNSICIAPDGNIWIASYFEWPSFYNGEKWTSFYSEENAPHWCEQVAPDNINKSIWVGYGGSVVAEYKDSVWHTHDLEPHTNSCIGIHDIFIDNTGNVWVGTWLGGVCKFDGTNWVNYTKTNGLPSNNVYAINQDPEGNILFGTGEGLTKYNGVSWTTYTTTDGLANNIVYDILVDGDSIIWLGTNGGLSVFDGSSFINYYQSDGIYNDVIKTLAKDNYGNLWIGCNEYNDEGGITCFNGTNWRSFSVEEGLANGGVNEIVVDDSNYIWIATDKGVSVLNQNLVGIFHNTIINNDFNIYPNPTLNTLYIKTNTKINEKSFYQVYTSTGIPITNKILLTEDITQIDLPINQKGFFLIIIKNERMSKTYKIIKQ